MSKRDVRNKKALHLAIDENLDRIIETISVLPIFEYDMTRCERLLNEIFVDLYIERDEDSAVEKIEEIIFLLNDEILKFVNDGEKIKDIVYLSIGKFNGSDIITDKIIFKIVTLFPSITFSKTEFSKLLTELKINALNKLTDMLNLKLSEEMKLIKQKYADNLILLKHLIDELKEDDKSNEFEYNEVCKDYYKIFDFRTLEKLVIDRGYELKSVEGSHHKYENADGKVVIIPKHSKDLGKGLSIAIQKRVDE